YSTTQQRSISFSVIYMIMNIGYVVAGWVFDKIRQVDLHVSWFGFTPTTHQQLFMVSLAIELVIFPVIYFLRRSEDGRPEPKRRVTSNSFAGRIAQTVSQSAVETIQLFRRLIGQSAFARILLFFLLIGFLKSIFLQRD